MTIKGAQDDRFCCLAKGGVTASHVTFVRTKVTKSRREARFFRRFCQRRHVSQ